MSLFHYFVLLTLSLVLIFSVRMAFSYKKRLSGMSSMVLSMAIGTNVGLTAGVLFGSIFQGNLFYATVYSILAGIVTGISCGLFLGILPTLEGFIAGLMGGMMGAMLGEMVTPVQSGLIINLFLTISVSTLFLFPILSTPSEKEPQRDNIKWLFKPLFTFLLLTTYLILGNNLDNQTIYSKSTSTNQKLHLSHPGQMIQREKKKLELTLNVKASKFSYAPAEITLKKGQTITLSLKNVDKIDHDIEIKDFPFEVVKSNNHNHHTNENLEFHIHAQAKTEAYLTFTPLKSGTYEFYCTIPGHKENGMVGLFVIT